MRFGSTVAIALVSLAIFACSKKGPEAGPEATKSDAGHEAGAGAAQNEDDVVPVYPVEENAPANPIAEKLCVGLTEMPEKKRAACCSTSPGILFTTECTRTLSAAIRHNAVTLAEPDVDRCIAAFEKRLDGCDWVGAFAPGPPPECDGIVKGKLTAGTKCRSSLECDGTLRCLGVGPTTPGKCGPVKNDGQLCGGTVDTLATYTRQNSVDVRHPECKDRCVKHKCAAAVTAGGVCQTTADCADGLQCLDGKTPTAKRTCTARAPSKEGEACPGGTCEGDLQCIRGKCGVRKNSGEACTSDFECRGGCLRGDGGDKGKCGPRCDVR